jgi:hypothetical protein
VICPRTAKSFGHNPTPAERERWCKRIQGQVKCDGCEWYKVEKKVEKVEKKEQGRLW